METSAFKAMLAQAIKQYIVYNQIVLEDTSVLNKRYKLSVNKYIDKINEVVNKDVEVASFGLKTKRLTVIQRSVMSVTFTHGLTKFAEYIVTGKDTLSEIN